MTITEKLTYIQDNHFEAWLTTRREADDDVSRKCSMFCVCGKLCTGLHESHCKRFQNAVTNEALKRLKHLFPTKKEVAVDK